jgi:hypothetical protein
MWMGGVSSYGKPATTCSHKPQDLLRAKSIEEFAAIQRDLYIDTINHALEASSILLQMAAGVAQEARPAPQSRSLIVPAH